MKKQKTHALILGTAILLILSTFVFPVEVPKEVKAMAGSYTGSWTMYGIDETGNIIKKFSWNDTMEAVNPIIKDGRAYVSVENKQKFSENSPPQIFKGTEGYFLNKDGSLGDYYYEMFGQVFKMLPLDKNTWTYTMPANPGELSMLGFSNVSYGNHVFIKVVTKEKDTEIHRVTRVSTIGWKDKKGAVQWKQFISLQGYHKRVK